MFWKNNNSKINLFLNDNYKIYSFGQKIKDLAKELFDMGDIKDDEVLINIANKMKDVNQNVWINYILKQCKDKNCIIDDLRPDNELNVLKILKIGILLFYMYLKTKIKRTKNFIPIIMRVISKIWMILKKV